MFLKRLSVGQLAVNCYIVADEDSKEAVIIDPGSAAERILKVVKENELKVKYIINTHGHADHISANQEILTETGAKLLIHQDDIEFLQNSELNLSPLIGQGEELASIKADRALEEGDSIKCGKLNFTVIHTPGHTPGSICLKLEQILFSGDTIFANGVGRTDFPGGSYQELRKSLAKILKFKEDLKLCPGHGLESTLDKVRRENAYI